MSGPPAQTIGASVPCYFPGHNTVVKLRVLVVGRKRSLVALPNGGQIWVDEAQLARGATRA